MLKIYHNPRCGKSREGLEILEKSGEDFEIIKYMADVPSKEELKSLIGYLDMKPIELVRKNEAVWKDNYKGKELSDAEIIRAMAEHPKLIERPIVVKGNKAVIGKPPEAIKKLL